MLLFELGPPGAAGGFAGSCQTAPRKSSNNLDLLNLVD
jgi:hypothetical protein